MNLAGEVESLRVHIGIGVARGKGRVKAHGKARTGVALDLNRHERRTKTQRKAGRQGRTVLIRAEE